MSRLNRDTVVALALLVGCGAFWVESFSIRETSYGQIQSWVWPQVILAVLTVMGRADELKLHIQAALNVGCTPQEVTEVIFQTSIYGGVPATNSALKTLRSVLKEKGLWPLSKRNGKE